MGVNPWSVTFHQIFVIAAVGIIFEIFWISVDIPAYPKKIVLVININCLEFSLKKMPDAFIFFVEIHGICCAN